MSPFSRTLRAVEIPGVRGYVIAIGCAAVLMVSAGLWALFGSVDVYVESKDGVFEVLNYAHPLQPQIDGTLVEAEGTLGAHVEAAQIVYALDAQPQKRLLAEEQARRTSSLRLVSAFEAEIGAQTMALEAADKLTRASANAASAKVRIAQTSFDYSARRDDILAALQEHDLVAGLESLQGEESRSVARANLNAEKSTLLLTQRSGRLSILDRDAQVAALRRSLVSVKGEVDIADARTAELEYDIERHNIRAPVAGVISSLSMVSLGATVHAGEDLGSVVPAEPIRVVAHFARPEAVGRVRKGQPVALRVDQYPWSQYGTLDGVVLSVASVASENLVRVDIQVVGTNPNIPTSEGLTGIAEVRVERIRPIFLLLRLAGQIVGR